MNWRRMWTIAVKEYPQFFRDRRTVVATMLMPLIQVVLYGYLSSDVRYQPTVVWDLSQTAAEPAAAETLYELAVFLDQVPCAQHARGRAAASRAGRRWRGSSSRRTTPSCSTRRRSPEVMVAVDASDATAARTSLSVAQAIGSSVTSGMVVKELRMNGVPTSRRSASTFARAPGTIPALRQEVFIVPGVLALVMQFTMTFLSMSTIVRERELGTLEQLVVSPIQPWELMLGKMIPLITIGYINVTTILLLAVFWFHVPVAGSVVLALPDRVHVLLHDARDGDAGLDDRQDLHPSRAADPVLPDAEHAALGVHLSGRGDAARVCSGSRTSSR